LTTHTLLAHIIFDDGIAASVAILIAQAFKQAPGGMPLLFRSMNILIQNLINDAQIRLKLGAAGRLLAAVTRRNRKPHHLGDGHAGKTKTARGFSLGEALHKYGTTNGSIKFHSAHPLGVP